MVEHVGGRVGGGDWAWVSWLAVLGREVGALALGVQRGVHDVAGVAGVGARRGNSSA